jgi:predicted ferric reductase
MKIRLLKLVFVVLWFTVMLVGPVTVFRTTSINDLNGNSILLLNFLQRLTATLAFSLIFIQIVLGVISTRWLKKFGSWVYKIHTTQGIYAYGLAFIHPLFENATVYITSKKLVDALLVFLPNFDTQRGLLLVYGRVAFLLLTIAASAGYFRTKPIFVRNWRYFHLLNYFVFYLIVFHARVGTDFYQMPFRLFFLISIVIVTIVLIYRFSNYLMLKINPPATVDKLEDHASPISNSKKRQS